MEDENVERLFKSALVLHQAGKLTEALELYQKLLKINAQHQASLNALYNIASIYASQNSLTEAIHLLEQITALDPSHRRAHLQLARVYYNQADYPKSIAHFQQAKALETENKEYESELHHDLGLSFLANKNYPQAIQELEECLKINEQHPEAHYHLATAYLKNEELNKALGHYLQQLSIKPMLEAYYNIGVLLTAQNRNQEAIPYFEEVLRLDPHYQNAHLNLGVIHLKFGRKMQAIHHYEEALKINPDDAEIRYILAGLSQSKETPSAAPAQYLSHLFDQYALYYDKHLQEHLQYQVPEQIFQCLVNNTPLQDSQWDMLDLGCGTGLSGILLKPFAKKLVGVDISENMLDLAEQKNIYTELVLADIASYLDKATDFNLIIAADVFSYHGNLQALFAKSHAALMPQGYFIFSVERGFEYPYHLETSLRYTHSKKYIEELIQQYHFECISFDNLILRHQQKEAVEGYLVLLSKAKQAG